jgi:AmmeMemoRadiSam system protein A
MSSPRLESALTADEGRRLLRWARKAIAAAVEGGPPPEISSDELTDGMSQPLGAFVTLYRAGELRGCIGRMQYDTPLYRNVLEAAASSALQDPRFQPVTVEEVPELRISLSILDEPRPIPSADQFDPNQHGIVMELGYAHGVFLPKVAREYGWDRSTTLTMLCRKIGLADDAWRGPNARFKIYHALEFVEEKA